LKIVVAQEETDEWQRLRIEKQVSGIGVCRRSSAAIKEI
jgi:hypothetical protein